MESRHHLLSGAQQRPDDLQSYNVAEFLIVGEVNFTHAALAQALHDSKSTN